MNPVSKRHPGLRPLKRKFYGVIKPNNYSQNRSFKKSKEFTVKEESTNSSLGDVLSNTEYRSMRSSKTYQSTIPNPVSPPKLQLRSSVKNENIKGVGIKQSSIHRTVIPPRPNSSNSVNPKGVGNNQPSIHHPFPPPRPQSSNFVKNVNPKGVGNMQSSIHQPFPPPRPQSSNFQKNVNPKGVGNKQSSVPPLRPQSSNSAKKEVGIAEDSSDDSEMDEEDSEMLLEFVKTELEAAENLVQIAFEKKEHELKLKLLQLQLEKQKFLLQSRSRRASLCHL